MQTDVPSVADVIHWGASLCDPEGHDEQVAAIVQRFEDDDRPARGLEGLAGVLGRAADEVDPEGDSPAVRMTAVSATWLATNADARDDRERALRESARAAFEGDPPEAVSAWLADRGVEV